MMKRHLVMALLLVMLCVGIVNAGTMLGPAANGAVLCGPTYTLSYNTTLSDTVNVTWYISLVNGSEPWTALTSAVNTSGNQTAFTKAFATTGLTDGIGYTINATATDGSNIESAAKTAIIVDNTGPVLSFASDNTNDKSFEYVQDVYISVTSNEQMLSAPTVNFKGTVVTLKNTSLFNWYYDFDWNELPDDTYLYSITGGADNTTCGTTGSNTIRREVNIYSKPSIAIKQAQKQEEQIAADKAQSDKTLVIVVAAVLVYFIFFHGKKGKKK